MRDIAASIGSATRRALKTILRGKAGASNGPKGQGFQKQHWPKRQGGFSVRLLKGREQGSCSVIMNSNSRITTGRVNWYLE